MTPLSICFVSPHARGALESRYGLPASAGFGGAELQTVLIGSGLAARGHQVTFVCQGGSSSQVLEHPIGPVRVLTFRGGPQSRGHRLHPIQSLYKALRHADSSIYYQRCAQPITGVMAR